MYIRYGLSGVYVVNVMVYMVGVVMRGGAYVFDVHACSVYDCMVHEV